MRRYIVNLPTVEPLTLAEVKRWLRVDHGDDDGLISGLIKAARERIEGRTGRALMAQTWRIVLDRWPGDGRVVLPVLPVLSVTVVNVLDAADVATPLASTLFKLEPGAEPPVLCVKSRPNPGRARNGIEIDIVAGYGVSPADCPGPLKQAMYVLIGQAYAMRGPERAEDKRSDAIAEVERIIAPYRQIKLGRVDLEGGA